MARAGRHAEDGTPDRRPWAIVALAVAWGAIALWPERSDVWYLNDAAVHRSMVEWAAARITDGHLPLDGWYPYLGMGASRFHHYQSLPHILTGAISSLAGRGAFGWSLYLLLATWPVSVYVGGRSIGLGRWPSAAAAGLSPLLVSAPGLGYEWGSYVWLGSGTWAQLWGMWLLPITLGCAVRAIGGRGRIWLGGLLLGLLIAAHLLTGYLAVLMLGVVVLARPSRFGARVVRAGGVLLVGLAAASWMLVPLVTDARWTINDEFSRGTIFYDSFGGPTVGRWFASGELFDAGRTPVITVLVTAGLIVAIGGWRREASRIVVGLAAVSAILFAGRPTFSWLIDLLPGSGDLFLRRYLSGVHLAGLYLAGLGLTWIVAWAHGWLQRHRRAVGLTPAAAAAVLAALAVAALAPALVERWTYARDDGRAISAQRSATATDGEGFRTLVERATAEGDGRLFAGRRSPEPASYRIGAVPGYAALLNLQADAVGFARPTWSLPTGAEFRLDPADPVMLELLGVRHLIAPDDATPPPGATEAGREGRHVWYRLDGHGYARVVDTVAPIAVDRGTIGERTSSFLTSEMAADGIVPLLAFDGATTPAPTLGPNEQPSGPAGRIVSMEADPERGTFAAQVDADRHAVVAFAVAYDPRFQAFLDGRRVTTAMLAPGVVGVATPSGSHEVEIVYRAYPTYGWLLLGAIIVVAGMAFLERRGTGRHRADPADVLEEAAHRADDSRIGSGGPGAVPGTPGPVDAEQAGGRSRA